jgi:hypothetical protein
MMKKTDIILIIIAAALVIGMILTAFFGRGSRHGYGNNETDKNHRQGRVCAGLCNLILTSQV